MDGEQVKTALKKALPRKRNAMEMHSEGAMVKTTVRQLSDRLERLLSWDVPTSSAFDLLARRASTVEELVVMEVMRECCEELESTVESAVPFPAAYYTDSKTLSA